MSILLADYGFWKGLAVVVPVILVSVLSSSNVIINLWLSTISQVPRCPETKLQGVVPGTSKAV